MQTRSYRTRAESIIFGLATIGMLISIWGPASAHADTVSLEVRPGSLVALPEETLSDLDITRTAPSDSSLRISNILVRDGRGTGEGWDVTLSLMTGEDRTPVSEPVLLEQSGETMGEHALQGSLAQTPNTGIIEITIQSR